MGVCHEFPNFVLFGLYKINQYGCIHFQIELHAFMTNSCMLDLIQPNSRLHTTLEGDQPIRNFDQATSQPWRRYSIIKDVELRHDYFEVRKNLFHLHILTPILSSGWSSAHLRINIKETKVQSNWTRCPNLLTILDLTVSTVGGGSCVTFLWSTFSELW